MAGGAREPGACPNVQNNKEDNKIMLRRKAQITKCEYTC